MEHLDLIPAAGIGTIDSFTIIHRAPRPDVVVPYTLARVRLPEGPIMLTRLLGDDRWVIGEQVRVGWFDLPDGRALPVFTRIDGDGRPR